MSDETPACTGCPNKHPRVPEKVTEGCRSRDDDDIKRRADEGFIFPNQGAQRARPARGEERRPDVCVGDSGMGA
jgi:hypothetical protein